MCVVVWVLSLLLLSCWLVRVVNVGVLPLTVLLDDVVGLLVLINVVLCFLCVVCGLVIFALLWLICLCYVLVIVALLVPLFVGLGYRFVVCFDGLRSQVS